MERFKAVIVSNGRSTNLFYNGKLYGEGITGVEFSHVVPDNPELKITSIYDTLPQEGTLEMDSFNKFLEYVMSDNEEEISETDAINRLLEKIERNNHDKDSV